MKTTRPFEQFVVCWLFQRDHSSNVPGSWKSGCEGGERGSGRDEAIHRVLELGGGIGAVSTMIQQNLQMVDSQTRRMSSSSPMRC